MSRTGHETSENTHAKASSSDFSAHSLIPVIGIVSGIMSGVLKLPIAKLLDLWGRAEGFAFMTLIGTIGLLLMAVCRNVETYAVAQVSILRK